MLGVTPVAIGGSLYSDAMGTAGTWSGTYLGMIDHNVTAIARALGGQAPEAGWRSTNSSVSFESNHGPIHRPEHSTNSPLSIHA